MNIQSFLVNVCYQIKMVSVRYFNITPAKASQNKILYLVVVVKTFSILGINILSLLPLAFVIPFVYFSIQYTSFSP